MLFTIITLIEVILNLTLCFSLNIYYKPYTPLESAYNTTNTLRWIVWEPLIKTFLKNSLLFEMIIIQ